MSFNDMQNDIFNYCTINNIDKYYAHKKNNGGNVVWEKLSEHIERVKKYFLSAINEYGLERVIGKHIEEIKVFFSEENQKNAENFIKLLFFETINFHDIGKLNPSFQEYIGNPAFQNSPNTSLKTNHSILSVYLFYGYMLSKMDTYFNNDGDKFIAYIFILLFSVSIRKHHSSELTSPFYYFDSILSEDKNRFFESINVNDLLGYLGILNLELNEDNRAFYKDIFAGNLAPNLENYYKKVFFTNIYNDNFEPFYLYSLIKLNFSLLTLSDYFATLEFMQGCEVELSGILSNNRKNTLYYAFYNSNDWNRRLGNGELPYDRDMEESAEENLNKLRYKMLYECYESLQNNINKNLFFIEAPTGGGKTNISFMAVTELLKKREDLRKVFYVFPFTTLVTQTKESLIKTFNLENNDYVELHSKAEIKENEEEYDWKNFVDYKFVNYPFVLLTHIKFFDIVKSYKKRDNYLYSQLANSIVVIDEIQAYSPEHWDKIYYFIKNISKTFNTVFIIMSATLPEINQINVESNRFDVINDFIHLNVNRQSYFLNPNFKNRVNFEFIGEASRNDLKNKIREALENNKMILIEFMFKKDASDFFNEVVNDENFEDVTNKYLLSGTILEPERKRIIKKIKEIEKNNNDKVILVSTQVIEAGVDIDFDIGFKETSIIDSDEQFAGRINRNARKGIYNVYLFNYKSNDKNRNNIGIIYGNDYRYKVQKDDFDNEKHLDCLRNKKFSDYYEDVFDYINRLNKTEVIYGFNDYKEALKKLSYSGVDNEFKLINSETLSVFLNVEFDLGEYGEFLGDVGEFAENNKLRGKIVWEKYCEIVENRDEDFIRQEANFTYIEKLMSNFVFSVFKYSRLGKALKRYGEEKYGYLYISNPGDIYDIRNGLNVSNLEESGALFY